MSSDAVHHETCDNPSLHKNLFQDSVKNEILTHYNRIVIGSFKEFFQSVNTNNLTEVLQTLKELNFMLANRAPELVAHYNMPLEPHQITAEGVPDLAGAHLHCNTAYNLEHSIRGRPCSRVNQYHWYNQQSSPLLRYNQHSESSDTHFHSNRIYGNIHLLIVSQCNSPRTVRNTPNTSNNQFYNYIKSKQFKYNRMFTNSNFRPSDSGIATMYIKLNKNHRWQQQKQIHIVGTECGKCN